MYDTLLDELEDDPSQNTEEVSGLARKSSVDAELQNDLEVAASSADAETEVEPKSEDLLAVAEEEAESWSDDPVRMYLTQMGEIPLLTRQEEITLAKMIEITRARFRRRLLECDYVIQVAVKVLNRVHVGELPFDRTVQVSVTDRLEKEQILGRFPHNLRTIETLLRQNRDDYRMSTSKKYKIAQRRAAWQRLGRRRRRAVLENFHRNIPCTTSLPIQRAKAACMLPASPGTGNKRRERVQLRKRIASRLDRDA